MCFSVISCVHNSIFCGRGPNPQTWCIIGGMDEKPAARKPLRVNSVILRFASLMLIMLALPFFAALVVSADRLSRMEKESANQFLSSNLRTVASTLDQVLMNLERLHAFIFMDAQFLNGLRRLSPYDSREEYGDYINTNSIKNRINHVAVTNDYIFSIYAYSFTAERIFSSKVNWNEKFNHFADAPWLRSYREQGLERPWHFTLDIQDGRPLLASYREVWTNNQPIGLVSVNVDTADIARMLDEVIPGEAGHTFIMDDRGNIIRGTAGGDDETGGPFIGRLVPGIISDQNDGFFDMSYNGKKMFVSHYRSPYSGFRFVAAAPLDQIQTSTPVMARLIMMFLLLQGLMIAVTLFLARHYFWTPIRALFAGMRQMREGDFSARLPPNSSYEFGYINSNFNEMADNIQKLVEENYASKLINREAQLKNLQNQLNEHFLYNTLDSIHWLARREKAAQASEMVFALAKFYRISLSAGHEVIPVRDAAEMMRNYLYIQKIRMRDALNYTIRCDPSLEDLLMPKGLLQPLVENALVHGLRPLEKGGEIRIVFDCVPGGAHVSVADNGVGITEERLRLVLDQLESPEAYRDQAFALKTVQSQIRLYYGVRSPVRIETSPGNGTLVWFEIPVMRNEKGSPDD